MSSAKQPAGLAQKVEQRQRGTTSLVLGVAAVAMIGCPFLPVSPSAWIRIVPVYFILPVGICAVVFGRYSLSVMRGDEGVARGRARSGVILGTVAIGVLLHAFLFWFRLG